MGEEGGEDGGTGWGRLAPACRVAVPSGLPACRPLSTHPRGHPSPAAGLQPHSAQRFCSPFLVQVDKNPSLIGGVPPGGSFPGPSLMLDTFCGRILGLVRHF